MTTSEGLTYANRAQIQAADPTTNSWISANAGSGKTRVLTNRVARLLLDGTLPQKILCLTYTKAAAGEMQNRLFDQLGKWAMLDDAGLRAQLSSMGIAAEELTEDRLSNARKLFAQALETPGGLKIQTIHAFCDGILRRFALEAKVTPNFEVIDDVTADELRSTVVEVLAHDKPALLAAIGEYLSVGELEKITREVLTHLDQFATAPDPKVFSVDKERLAKATIDAATNPILTELVPIFESGGREKNKVPELKSALAEQSEQKRADKLRAIMVSKDAPYKPHSWYPGSGTMKNHAALQSDIDQLRHDLALRAELLAAQESYHRAEVLHEFAVAFLDRYAAAKRARGLLDYDDLIRKTCDLLETSAMAQWVLYRLDGGIDQILLDEAQDTSPLQWRVIDRLRAEFHAGLGQSDHERTLFVVGDDKQSIYSFQGADADLFDRKRTSLRKELSAQDVLLNETALDFSFRSAPPILNLVDQIFSSRAGAAMPQRPKHSAPNPDKFGHVEIWPFIEKEKAATAPDWHEPVGGTQSERHERQLALKIAAYLQERISEGSIQPMDVMILFRTRGRLYHETLKALKEFSLPVMGADRLKLGTHLAVQDILSVLRFALQPDDDLSLAEALRSPLVDLSERDLFRLAHGRGKKTLYQMLRNSTHHECVEILRDLRAQIEKLRPYELIERLLIRHRGLARLIGRMGHEVLDAVDALLSEALHYEQVDAPNLAGFIHWFDGHEVEIKRSANAQADEISLMTIHGAKGLERRLVILPDTHRPEGGGQKAPRLVTAKGQVIWRMPKDKGSNFQIEADAQTAQSEDAEDMRLLYVALTRAEHELIIAGAGARAKDETDWYGLISHGFDQLGAIQTGDTRILRNGDRVEQSDDVSVKDAIEMPAYFHHKAPNTVRKSGTISPSNLPGEKSIQGAQKDDGLAAVRGDYMHHLLDLLSKNPDSVHDRIKERLRRKFPEIENGKEIEEQAENLLAAYPEIFAADTLSEVTLGTPLSFDTDQKIFGIVDRLIISKDKATIIDFKSNTVVPNNEEDVPAGIMAQMGAYADGITQIYPDRKIELLILWTARAKIMSISHDRAIAALKTATSA